MFPFYKGKEVNPTGYYNILLHIEQILPSYSFSYIVLLCSSIQLIHNKWSQILNSFSNSSHLWHKYSLFGFYNHVDMSTSSSD